MTTIDLLTRGVYGIVIGLLILGLTSWIYYRWWYPRILRDKREADRENELLDASSEIEVMLLFVQLISRYPEARCPNLMNIKKVKFNNYAFAWDVIEADWSETIRFILAYRKASKYTLLSFTRYSKDRYASTGGQGSHSKNLVLIREKLKQCLLDPEWLFDSSPQPPSDGKRKNHLRVVK